MKTFTSIFISAFLLASCSSTEPLVESEPGEDVTRHPTTQATAWVQNSAEYKALAIQTYRTAKYTLPLPLQDSFWTASPDQEKTEFNSLPPAIIFDVDETVLDNSPFQARMIKNQSSFNNEAWNEWCNEANASGIPGAADFATYTANQGVEIFYITNRDFEVEEATRRNLVAEGFPVSDSLDNIMSNGEEPEWTSSKVERRKLVEQHYRVLMIIGDDLNDFISAKNISEQERDTIISEYAGYFGKRWFMLPNPVYGSWDQAMYNFSYDYSDEERQQILLEHLNSKEKN
ncbi:MAG: 5'-nucleotidase, lipoprotein e(P4) family [Balneolaceae bacterium]